jgi:hypothetical protein
VTRFSRPTVSMPSLLGGCWWVVDTRDPGSGPPGFQHCRPAPSQSHTSLSFVQYYVARSRTPASPAHEHQTVPHLGHSWLAYRGRKHDCCLNSPRLARGLNPSLATSRGRDGRRRQSGGQPGALFTRHSDWGWCTGQKHDCRMYRQPGEAHSSPSGVLVGRCGAWADAWDVIACQTPSHPHARA